WPGILTTNRSSLRRTVRVSSDTACAHTCVTRRAGAPKTIPAAPPIAAFNSCLRVASRLIWSTTVLTIELGHLYIRIQSRKTLTIQHVICISTSRRTLQLSAQRHRDTEAQRRANHCLMRAFVPPCLCVSVLTRRGLALDRFSIFQLESKYSALAGVVVGVALFGRQALQIRLDEAQLFKPIDRAGGECEDAGHPELCCVFDQVGDDLSAHARVAVHRIGGYRGDLALALAVVVEGSARVDHVVDRVNHEVAMPRHEVILAPFDEDAFLHEGLHQAQHIADVV